MTKETKPEDKNTAIVLALAPWDYLCRCPEGEHKPGAEDAPIPNVVPGLPSSRRLIS